MKIECSPDELVFLLRPENDPIQKAWDDLNKSNMQSQYDLKYEALEIQLENLKKELKDADKENEHLQDLLLSMCSKKKENYNAKKKTKINNKTNSKVSRKEDNQ